MSNETDLLMDEVPTAPGPSVLAGGGSAPVVPEPAPAAPATTAGSDQLVLTRQDLAAIIAEATRAATETALKHVTAQTASTEQLVQAILESRKPYVDPKKAENDRRAREQMDEATARMRRDIEASRDVCQHKQGSNPNSISQGQGSSFVLHVLDTGELIGICTNCQKLISSLNPGDRKFFAVKSANIVSQSGSRIFMDPLRVQRAGAMMDDNGRRMVGS